MAIHLENGQRVYFTDQNAAARAESPPKTTLTEFFTLCQQDTVYGRFAKTLLYSDVPTYFTWDKTGKVWKPRKRGKPVDMHPGIFSTNVLGSLYTVHPKQRDCFYLRLLLINVRGPTSFDYLKFVNGTLHATNHDACLALKLLEGDAHWDTTMADAVLITSNSRFVSHNINNMFPLKSIFIMGQIQRCHE